MSTWEMIADYIMNFKQVYPVSIPEGQSTREMIGRSTVPALLPMMCAVHAVGLRQVGMPS
jgi:hypothetical protein